MSVLRNTLKHINHCVSCSTNRQFCIEKPVSHCLFCNTKGQCLQWETHQSLQCQGQRLHWETHQPLCFLQQQGAMSALSYKSIIVTCNKKKMVTDKQIHHHVHCNAKGNVCTEKQVHHCDHYNTKGWCQETHPSSFSLQHQVAISLRNPSITMFPATPRGNITEKLIHHHFPCNTKGQYHWETRPSPCSLPHQGAILRNPSSIIYLAMQRGNIEKPIHHHVPCYTRGKNHWETHPLSFYPPIPGRNYVTEKHIQHHFPCKAKGWYHLPCNIKGWYHWQTHHNTKGWYHWETHPSSFFLWHQGAVSLRNISILICPATSRGNIIKKHTHHHFSCSTRGQQQ